MYHKHEGPELKLSASNLPAASQLEEQFGIMEYSSLSTLRSKFCPPAFDKLGQRELKILPATEVGISYTEQNGSPANYHPDLSGYNVVVSFPKNKHKQEDK